MKTMFGKKSWYEEVCLGLRKTIKVGGSLGFIIPVEIIRKYDMKEGDKFVVLLLERVRTLSDEMTPEEETQFAQFKKNKLESDAKIKSDVEKLRKQTKKPEK